MSTLAADRENTMKAIVQDKYGSTDDVLKLKDIDKPVVKDDEMLVRVHAAAVNISDWILMRGVPHIMRMASGLRKQKNGVPGQDIARKVEAVGKNVKQLRPGDDVFGWCKGAFAEYACWRVQLRAEAGQSHVRASRGRWGVRIHRPSGSSQSREGLARAEGLDQRCVERRGDVRRAARQVLWSTSYRGMQYHELRIGGIFNKRKD